MEKTDSKKHKKITLHRFRVFLLPASSSLAACLHQRWAAGWTQTLSFLQSPGRSGGRRDCRHRRHRLLQLLHCQRHDYCYQSRRWAFWIDPF